MRGMPGKGEEGEFVYQILAETRNSSAIFGFRTTPLVPEFRNWAGLPEEDSGEWIQIGILVDRTGGKVGLRK